MYASSPCFIIVVSLSASANSEGHESVGYMDMRPGSMVNSPASQHESYMVMTPPASSSASSSGAYMSMTPPLQNTTSSGYIEMTPGQRSKLKDCSFFVFFC